MTQYTNSLEQQWKKWQFSKRLQAAFWEDLVSLVEDGVSLTQTLEVLASLDHPILVAVASSLLEAVSAGKPLAEGMQAWFSPMTCAIIDAGEAGGTLLNAMQACAKDASQQGGLSKMAWSSLLYPLLVMCLALGVVVFVKRTVLQELAGIKPLSSWPSTSLQLYQLAQFVQNAWFWLLCDAVIFYMAWRFFCRHYIGKLRRTLDHWPLVGLYRQAQAWRFMRVLGVLMNNGIMLKQALSLIASKANPYLVWHLNSMQHALDTGTLSLSDVLNTGLLDRQDITRLSVLSQHKGAALSLNRLSDQASDRWSRSISRGTRVLAALFLLASAAVAALLIFGIYTIASVIAT